VPKILAQFLALQFVIQYMNSMNDILNF